MYIFSGKTYDRFTLSNTFRRISPIFNVSHVTLFLFLALSIAIPLQIYGAGQKNILIINSYSDGEPWSDQMTQPIVHHIASIDEADCSIINLNNAYSPNSITFDQIADEIISDRSITKPDYIVYVGIFAFNLRYRIKDKWGDLPTLLISKITETAPIDRNINTGNKPPTLDPNNVLYLQRDQFNFSAIIVPDYYEETVDLMMKLIPDMQQLIFCSDSIYVNRHASYFINDYMNRYYPNVKFRWLKANSANADTLRHYFTNHDPNTGLLMSSWYYNREATNNGAFMSTGDIRIMSSSKTPIFSMREPYLNIGAVGGVYPNTEQIKSQIIKMLDKMLKGHNMRNVPFFISPGNRAVINYNSLTKYNLDPKACPPNTIFIEKPLSFLERYMWQTIAFGITMLLIIAFLVIFISMQRKRIRILHKNADFINNMPIPYSSVKVRIGNGDKISKFDFTLKNAAFKKLISDNSYPNDLFTLFPSKFIIPKLQNLLSSQDTVFFQYHFEKTDTYYDFILCLVKAGSSGDSYRTKYIDLFALDITHLHKMADELKSTARKLDITLEAAKITPFFLDAKKGTITFDSHEPNESASADTDRYYRKKQTVITIPELYASVHPDDLEKVKSIIEQVKRGVANDFRLQYRCFWSRKPNPKKEYNDWAEVLGTIVESPDKADRYKVIGSLQNITSRKEHEAELTNALERANESDRLKSAFLANMSHEIRTPLNAIVGMSHLIAHTDNVKKRIEFWDIINRNNEQLLGIIDDLLDMARIEANMITINLEPCDVNNLLNNIKQSINPKVPDGVTFNLILGQKKCIALIDPIKMTQVLTNLLVNSCKFTTSGNISFGYEIIKTDKSSQNKMIHFFVKDTGKGMTREGIARVFDRFFKADEFAPGTGLGLPICKNLVNLMDGEIEVKSDGLGKGTLISVVIPYLPSAEADMAPTPSGTSTARRLSPSATTSRPSTDIWD